MDRFIFTEYMRGFEQVSAGASAADMKLVKIPYLLALVTKPSYITTLRY